MMPTCMKVQILDLLVITLQPATQNPSANKIFKPSPTAILKILIYLFLSVNCTGPQYEVFVKSTLTLCTNILKLLASLLLPYIVSILTLVAHLNCFLCCTCFDSFVNPNIVHVFHKLPLQSQ